MSLCVYVCVGEIYGREGIYQYLYSIAYLHVERIMRNHFGRKVINYVFIVLYAVHATTPFDPGHNIFYRPVFFLILAFK